MTKEELIEEIEELMENNAGQIEILEFIQDNTDLDPFEILTELM